MKLGLISLTILASAAPWTPASGASPRSVLARHDPDGRLANTNIRKLGVVRVGSAVYSIYYLNFTNPISRHGQQRIAIIKNGEHFAGAYQCTLGRNEGKLVFRKDRIIVDSGGIRSVIRFDERGPTRNKYFCAEGSGWENSI